jgi:hypothetical protein
VTPEFLIQLLVVFAGAAGVYAAIKADLTRAIVMAELAIKEAGGAHDRLSSHLEKHHDARVCNHG